MLKYIGERIKEARESKCMSQKKLGMVLGLSDKAISAYEAGRTFPPIDTLFRIAQQLEKPISYFLTEDNDEIFLTQTLSRIDLELSSISKEIDELKKKLAN